MESRPASYKLIGGQQSSRNNEAGIVKEVWHEYLFDYHGLGGLGIGVDLHAEDTHLIRRLSAETHRCLSCYELLG